VRSADRLWLVRIAVTADSSILLTSEEVVNHKMNNIGEVEFGHAAIISNDYGNVHVVLRTVVQC